MDLRLLRCALVATLAILVASQPVAAIRIGTGLLSTSSAGVCRNAAVMHERSPRIVTLFVNVTTNDYTSNAVSDMAFVSDSLRDLDAIRKSMYYSHDGLTMEVNDSTTPDILGSYVRHNNVNVIQGVLTQELALSSSVPILDPIASPSTLLHWGDTTVVYLYATLEQQFFVYSFYAASLKKMPSIRAVLRNTSGMVAVESILNESIQYNRLRLESVVYFEDHVEDALHPLGVSVIVGLKENDVVPLLTFLRQHEEASVVVNFDELTLLYKSICSAYNNAYHSSMRRVLYSTNLPQWSSPPSNPRDVTLSLFFDNIPKNRWTPAALRTFLGSFLLDDLAFTLCLSPQSNLMDDIYTNTIFAQDDDMTFGPFIRQCNYPSNTPSDCRVNYGARNIRLWNLASAFITKEGPLSSPLTVYLSGDDMVINNRNGMGYDNPILTAVLCVMGATIAAFCILACLSARGVFDKSTEMVTVLHVGIQHRFAMQHDGETDYDALLAQFSVAVDELIVSHRCLQLDSSPHGFTAVARHAMDALRLSHDLHDAFRALCEEHSVPRLLTMHMGLHSGLCCCTRALDYGDVAELLQRVAPLSMLAACVSDLCSVSEVLLTKGTHQELGRDGHLSEDVRVHGEYQLDQQPDRVKVFSWKVSEHRRPSERVSKVLSICVQESSAFSFNPLSPEALDVSNSSIGWDAHGTDRVSFIS